jgi:hypothetical protein
MLETKFAAIPPDYKNRTALKPWLHDVRAQSHLFMVTYLEYPSHTKPSAWSTNGHVFSETYSRCRYQYTRLFGEDIDIKIPPEEQDLQWAVEETQGALCSVLLTVGFDIEQTWTDFITGSDSLRIRERVTAWNKAVQELTAWLGWENEFIGCKEVCAWDERCYIPMWPLISGRRGFGGGPPPPRNGTRPPGRGPPGGRRPPNKDDIRPDVLDGPPRNPFGWGDETDLWEPKCVNADFLRGPWSDSN